MRCRSEFPGKAASWISLRVVFNKYRSISPSIGIHVLATSFCLGANEGRLARSVHEEISTGFESENQIRLKQAIVRRRLAPLSKRRHCQERSPLFQC